MITLLILNKFGAETSGWLPDKRYFTRVNIRQHPVVEMYFCFESCLSKWNWSRTNLERQGKCSLHLTHRSRPLQMQLLAYNERISLPTLVIKFCVRIRSKSLSIANKSVFKGGRYFHKLLKQILKSKINFKK